MRKIKKLPMLCIISLCLNMPSLVAAATSIEAPENLSQEAQDYLNKARVGAMDGGDSSDPETLARIRTMLGKIFLRSAMKIDPELFLTEQPMGSVTGYWINSKAPAKPGPVIIYLHGGGHILGSAKTNLGSAIRIARSGIIPVLSIDYRLAPEHPFPADLNDSVAAYRWLLDNGYAARQIGVYGDSAGGGLSVAMPLAAMQQNLPAPGAVASLSPSVDHTGAGDTRITLRNTDPILRTVSNDRRVIYAGDTDAREPLLSPVYADFTGFPPLLIQVGTRELLLSDAVRLARKARADGVAVTLDIWDGMWHGWHDTPELPEAEQACLELAQFFEKYLTSTQKVDKD
jgi:monoterpene epsilon-lactone hydrolase